MKPPILKPDGKKSDGMLVFKHPIQRLIFISMVCAIGFYVKFNTIQSYLKSRELNLKTISTNPGLATTV